MCGNKCNQPLTQTAGTTSESNPELDYCYIHLLFFLLAYTEVRRRLQIVDAVQPTMCVQTDCSL